ncbi:MAG: Uncharacterised protein [Polaribacter sp. SA4-10]|nr:MAG: Uncharacterised protein [Polaribacter sp. SA4-10]
MKSNLNVSLFGNYELKRAIFDQSNLEKVDFRTSINFYLNIQNNIFKKAIFNRNTIKSLLSQYKIIIV